MRILLAALFVFLLFLSSTKANKEINELGRGSREKIIEELEKDSEERGESEVESETDESQERFLSVIGSSLSGQEDVGFYLYTRRNPQNPEEYRPSSNSRITYTQFNPNLQTKIIVHGWGGSGTSARDGNFEFSRNMKDAFLNNGHNVNVILVDWSSTATSRLYTASARSVQNVGPIVATFVNQLASIYSLDITSGIHFIGFSLGAHVVGLAAYNLNGRAGKVTGLDPAFPMFRNLPDSQRLSPLSGAFVEVIHTCGNLLGFLDPIGHVDFYLNEGKHPQPTCGADPNGSCSHNLAPKVYMDALANTRRYATVSCPNYSQFRNGNCDRNTRIYLGEEVNVRARGTFYFTANVSVRRREMVNF